MDPAAIASAADAAPQGLEITVVDKVDAIAKLVQKTPSAQQATAALAVILQCTGSLPAWGPPEALWLILQEMLRCGVIASGGTGSGVVASQGQRSGYEYMIEYEESYPAFNAFLKPFLERLPKVPGNKLSCAADSLPACCVRQAAPNCVFTSESSSNPLGLHWDAEPSTLSQSWQPSELQQHVRALWSFGQMTDMHIVGGAATGGDLLCRRSAPHPGGGTWLAGEARCEITAPFAPHASVRRDFFDQQLLIDFQQFNPDGTAQLCAQLGMWHAARRAMRSLPAQHLEAESSERASPMDESE